MNIVSAFIDEVVGSDKRNKQIANGVKRTYSTQFDLAAWNASLETVGSGLSFDFT